MCWLVCTAAQSGSVVSSVPWARSAARGSPSSTSTARCRTAPRRSPGLLCTRSRPVPTALGSTSAGGQVRKRLAAYDANGSLTSWRSSANGLVSQRVLSGDQLWAAGSFGSIGGEAHRGVAALDLATGLATGWDAGADANVSSLAVSGDSVFVGGDFETIGGK